MAKVLGVEQETEARAPAVNPKEYSIRGLQSFDVGEATSDIQRGLTDYIKAEKSRELGADIAAANEKIQNITNPVERELAYDRAKNSLYAKHGAEAIPKVNAGLQMRKLEQIVDPVDGSIRTIDSSTKQLVGAAGPTVPTTPEQVFQRRMEKNSPVMESNLPNFTAAATTLITDASAGGGSVGLGDALHVSDKAISSFQNLKRNVEVANATRLDIRVSSGVAAEQRKVFAMQARNDAIGVLQSLRNASLAREIGRKGSLVTPEKAMAVAQSYITDIVSQFQELGADKSLGIDMYQFTKDLNEVAKATGEYFDTVAHGDVKRTKRAADIAKNTVDFYTNTSILDLRERNPQAFNALAQGPALQALTNALTAMQSLQAQNATFGPMGSSLSNSITDILFGARANEAIFSKIERREIRTAADLNTVISDMQDVLARGGANYLPDFREFMIKQKPSIQSLDLSEKDKKRMEEFFKRLDIADKQVEQTLESQGVTKEQQKESWKWLRDLGKFFSDDRKRTR